MPMAIVLGFRGNFDPVFAILARVSRSVQPEEFLVNILGERPLARECLEDVLQLEAISRVVPLRPVELAPLLVTPRLVLVGFDRFRELELVIHNCEQLLTRPDHFCV